MANFILGIALFAAVYMSVGKQITPAVIGDIMPNMPAAEAGLQPGDKVIEIDGIDIRNLMTCAVLLLKAQASL